MGDGYDSENDVERLQNWRNVFPARSVCDNSCYYILNKLQSSGVTCWKAQVPQSCNNQVCFELERSATVFAVSKSMTGLIISLKILDVIVNSISISTVLFGNNKAL